MARRKRHPKLPNGFGSIKYLGKGRYKPYGVYPPVTEYTDKGPVTPKAIAYVETWDEGYELLAARKMENEGKIKIKTGVYIDRTPTFKEVYEDFYKEKYRSELKDGKKTASMCSTQAAYKNSATLHDMRFGQIRYKDMQDILNACTLKHASQELIVSLMHQMYKYAIKYDIVEKDYSTSLFIPVEDDDEGGVPFTEDEIRTLWEHKENPVVQMLLIMCYSGFRIKAFTDLEVNLELHYFKGGVKTKSGKNRIVPIHSAIYDMVTSRYKDNRNLLGCSAKVFRNQMYDALAALGIGYASTGEKHTPHDCRHTFSTLCEHFRVNENDRKRMMGHSFKNDITNEKYGHRTLEELREEIEKIKPPLGKE